jgi:hypothetical protein
MAEAVQIESIKKVAGGITDSVQKASEAVTGDGNKGGSQAFHEAKGTESDKIKDLHRDIVDVHSSGSMTTDFGHKVGNTDNWLKIATEKFTGPHLLEDQQAREKASSTGCRRLHQITNPPRFIVSTMNGSPNVLFTLEDLLPLANSLCSKARRMLPLPLY